MFSFLNPLMLFGMAAGSIPLIIHFLTKRKVQRVFFGSLRFLKEMEGSKKNRINIDFLLLLLLRILIILFFCAALARPLWRKKTDAVVSKPKETMVTSVEIMYPLRVLLITDSEDSDEENFYIKQALSPAKDSPIILETANWIPAFAGTTGEFSGKKVSSFSTVIINNVSKIDEKLQGALLKFANSGGGILISLGNNVSIKDYDKNSSLLPAIPKFKIGNEEETDRYFKITYFDKSHPVFKVFTDESFTSSHFYSFYTVGAVREPSLHSCVLAGFDDGSPFIVEKKIGAGRVLLFTSPLDSDWSNFPVSPNYLPLLHQAVYYLARTPLTPSLIKEGDQGGVMGAPLPTKEISSIFLLLVLVLLIFEHIVSNKKFRTGPYKLRLAAILIILLILLQPSIPITREKIKKNNLIFLVDNSGSMGILNENGKDRLSRLKGLFKEKKFFSGLSKKNDMHFYSFSSKLNKIDVKDIQALQVGDSNTDFSSVLTEINGNFDVKSIAGVFILSDGIDSDPIRTLKLVENMPYPVFTVGPGEERTFKDISIKLQNVPENVFLDKKTTINFVVESFKDVFCVLKEDGTEIKKEKFPVKPGKNVLALEWTPKNLGPHRYSISIPVEDGEASSKNNQEEFYLDVRKEGPYVLVLAGAPSLEYKFLHKYLSKEPCIKAGFLVLKNETEFFDLGFPKTKEELFKYDVIILNDIQEDGLPESATSWIKEFVGARGGGVLALGDKNSSALEDILPVVFRKEGALLNKDKFSFELTKEGKGHQVAQLVNDSVQNSQIWKELPAVEGYNIVGRGKPGATVLAVRSGDKNIVWAVQSYGKGRTMAVIADGLWQWDFLMVGIGKTSEVYEHFWDRVVSWLTSTKEDVFDDKMDSAFVKKDLTEWRNLRIDEKFLKEISNKGHGKFCQNLKTKVAYNLTLWDNIFVFCLFVALLAYEWYLRKMSGLK